MRIMENKYIEQEITKIEHILSSIRVNKKVNYSYKKHKQRKSRNNKKMREKEGKERKRKKKTRTLKFSK